MIPIRSDAETRSSLFSEPGVCQKQLQPVKTKISVVYGEGTKSLVNAGEPRHQSGDHVSTRWLKIATPGLLLSWHVPQSWYSRVLPKTEPRVEQ